MQAQSKRTDVKQNKYLWLDMRKGKIMEKRMPVIGKAWLKDENEITQWITSKEAENTGQKTGLKSVPQTGNLVSRSILMS